MLLGALPRPVYRQAGGVAQIYWIMFIHHRNKGFVLKETEKGEADRILTIFSQDFGRIEVLAKAIRKMQSKLRGGAPLFSICEIEFIEGRSYKTLTDAILINGFENLKKNLERLEIAYKIADVFVQLVKPPQQDEKIWGLLKEVFEHLNDPQSDIKDLQITYSYFFWRLLAILGYQPELYSCLDCQKQLKQESLGFSVKGGIVCESCWQKNDTLVAPIQVDTIKILREVFKRNFKELKLIKLDLEHWESLDRVSTFYLTSLLN